MFGQAVGRAVCADTPLVVGFRFYQFGIPGNKEPFVQSMFAQTRLPLTCTLTLISPRFLDCSPRRQDCRRPGPDARHSKSPNADPLQQGKGACYRSLAAPTSPESDTDRFNGFAAPHGLFDWVPAQSAAVVAHPDLLRVPPLLVPKEPINGPAVHRGFCGPARCESA